MDSSKYVQLEHINMIFKTKKGPFQALQDVNLNIAEGEFVSLIGHSGCGKSTVLNIVAGLLNHTDGVALCADREIRWLGRIVGWCFRTIPCCRG
ncbi:ATP-binding cassette domain-containing protein [Thiothrix subterranea]|uniref:ATP-binding cassette domain-containing protein n=1 Tax=Thiothrix subterranea TaxID=2735563 RepID=UPI00280A78C1|nr:ATP-binding cassette domain-containing protein [Thiothrix subterranea]